MSTHPKIILISNKYVVLISLIIANTAYWGASWGVQTIDKVVDRMYSSCFFCYNVQVNQWSSCYEVHFQNTLNHIKNLVHIHILALYNITPVLVYWFYPYICPMYYISLSSLIYLRITPKFQYSCLDNL